MSRINSDSLRAKKKFLHPNSNLSTGKRSQDSVDRDGVSVRKLDALLSFDDCG